MQQGGLVTEGHGTDFTLAPMPGAQETMNEQQKALRRIRSLERKLRALHAEQKQQKSTISNLIKVLFFPDPSTMSLGLPSLLMLNEKLVALHQLLLNSHMGVCDMLPNLIKEATQQETNRLRLHMLPKLIKETTKQEADRLHMRWEQDFVLQHDLAKSSQEVFAFQKQEDRLDAAIENMPRLIAQEVEAQLSGKAGTKRKAEEADPSTSCKSDKALKLATSCSDISENAIKQCHREDMLFLAFEQLFYQALRRTSDTELVWEPLKHFWNPEVFVEAVHEDASLRSVADVATVTALFQKESFGQRVKALFMKNFVNPYPALEAAQFIRMDLSDIVFGVQHTEKNVAA